MNNDLIGEENAILLVLSIRVNPGVAVEMNSAMARNILESERFEKEFTKMIISDEESSGDSNFFIPIKSNSEGSFSCKYWNYCIGNPILQLGCLPHLPLKPFYYFFFFSPKEKKETLSVFKPHFFSQIWLHIQ